MLRNGKNEEVDLTSFARAGYILGRDGTLTPVDRQAQLKLASALDKQIALFKPTFVLKQG